MVNRVREQFTPAGIPLFLWFLLYGLLWWPFVSSGDAASLLIGVILAVIVLLKHDTSWALVWS